MGAHFFQGSKFCEDTDLNFFKLAIIIGWIQVYKNLKYHQEWTTVKEVYFAGNRLSTFESDPDVPKLHILWGYKLLKLGLHPV